MYLSLEYFVFKFVFKTGKKKLQISLSILPLTVDWLLKQKHYEEIQQEQKCQKC